MVILDKEKSGMLETAVAGEKREKAGELAPAEQASTTSDGIVCECCYNSNCSSDIKQILK